MTEPVAANSIDTRQFLDQFSRLLNDGTGESFNSFLKQMVSGRSSQSLSQMHSLMIEQEARAMEALPEIVSLRRLNAALAELRNESIAYKAATAMKMDEGPSVRFAHVLLGLPGQRMPVVLRTIVRRDKSGKRKPNSREPLSIIQL